MAISMAPQLLAGERVLATERQHPAVLVPAAAVTAVCLAAALVLIHLVPSRVLNRDVGGIETIADAVVVVVAAGWVLARLLRWGFQTYTLTTHRIVLSCGVVSRFSESIGLDRVQDTAVRRPLAARLIGAGSVEIQSAGRDGTEVLRLVPHAERFYTDVLQAIEDHRNRGMAMTAAAAGTAAA